MDTEHNDMGNEKERKLKLVRQARLVKEITYASIKKQSEDQSTLMVAVTTGIIQGLKYEGSFSRGLKAGLLVYSVLIGARVASNLSRSKDDIKNA